MAEISWSDFERVEIRAGTVTRVETFPEARQPAYKIWVDLGPLGIKQSSARITDLYKKDDLLGRQVICVCNFPPKQIGPFRSELLITGFYREDGAVVIARPDAPVPNGALFG
jgi:tRNA-binding protein